MVSVLFSQPRRKQKCGIYEDEGLAGMLKLCTAVMRHDPSVKMSPAGLVTTNALSLKRLHMYKIPKY